MAIQYTTQPQPSYLTPPGYRSPPPPDTTPSIESILSEGRFEVPPSDPIDAIITDRVTVATLGLGDTIRQIQRRYDIYNRHMDDVEQAKLAAINATQTWFARGPDIPQQESLHRLLQSFYAEQRSERRSLWKDISKLRQSIPEWAQQYLGSYRRQQIMDDGGDLS